MLQPKIKVGTKFTDIYGRKRVVTDAVIRTNEDGEEYVLYNIYPANEKPKKATDPIDINRGFKYATYVEILEEGLLYTMGR